MEMLRVLFQLVLKIQMVQMVSLLENLNIILVYIITIFVVFSDCILMCFASCLKWIFKKYTVLNWLPFINCHY